MAGERHQFAKRVTVGTSGLIVVYDVTDQNSFEKAKNCWFKYRDEMGDDNFPTLLVGNKSDLTEQISEQEAEEFAQSKGILHIKTSAINGNNVNEAFMHLAESKYDCKIA